MRPLLRRGPILVGGGLLVACIFLPHLGFGCLAYEIRMWWRALGSAWNAQEPPWVLLELAAEELAVLFTPACGVLCVVVALLPGPALRSRWLGGLVLLLLACFAIPIAVVAGTWGFTEAGGIPPGVTLTAAGVSVTLLLVCLTLLLVSRAPLPAVLVPPLALLGLGLCVAAGWILTLNRRSWEPWGLAVGGVGACLGLVGCLLEWRRSR